MRTATVLVRRFPLFRIGAPLAFRQLAGRRSGQAGLVLAAMVVGFVVFAPLAIGGDPDAQDLIAQLHGPSSSHPLGTDQFGRDVLARVAEGGRRSLMGATLMLSVTFGLGLFVGVVAGLAGGVVDSVLMRVVDVFLAMPALIIAIGLVGALGPSFTNLVIALVAAAWPFYARIARGFTLNAALRPDVIAARLAGVGRLRILLGHIVPGAASRLLVVVSLDFGGAILALAGLSFLGLGAQPPAAEWGAILADSRNFFTVAPWLLLAPGIAIVLAATAANLIAESLRDLADEPVPL
jgi:ABC-type dipeptide/oligopeptide/nickel transport system permease subunit